MIWKRTAPGRHEGYGEAASAVIEYRGFDFEWHARCMGLTRRGQAATIKAAKRAAEEWVATCQ